MHSDETALCFHCPACDEPVIYLLKMVGQSVTCPGCKASVVVPLKPYQRPRSDADASTE